MGWPSMPIIASMNRKFPPDNLEPSKIKVSAGGRFCAAESWSASFVDVEMKMRLKRSRSCGLREGGRSRLNFVRRIIESAAWVTCVRFAAGRSLAASASARDVELGEGAAWRVGPV